MTKEFNLYGPFIGRLLWERTFEQHLLEDDRAKVHAWKCLYLFRKQGLCLLVSVDDIEVAAKKEHFIPSVGDNEKECRFWRIQRHLTNKSF